MHLISKTYSYNNKMLTNDCLLSHTVSSCFRRDVTRIICRRIWRDRFSRDIWGVKGGALCRWTFLRWRTWSGIGRISRWIRGVIGGASCRRWTVLCWRTCRWRCCRMPWWWTCCSTAIATFAFLITLTRSYFICIAAAGIVRSTAARSNGSSIVSTCSIVVRAVLPLR